MKKLSVIWIFLAFLASLPAVQANMITFNDPGLVAGYEADPFQSGTPKGTSPITDQYQSLGVLFSIDTYGIDFVTSPAFVGGQASPSGGNLLGVDSVLQSNPTTLTAKFVDPSGTGLLGTISALSFSVFIADTEASVILRTFGLNGGLLEEKALTTQSATFTFSVGQIARVEFFDLGGDGHTIGDFSFGKVTPVPLPPTIWLVFSALPGLVVVLGKRKVT